MGVVQGAIGFERQGIRLDLPAVTQVAGLCIQGLTGQLPTVAQLLGIELYATLSRDGSCVGECVTLGRQILSGTNGATIGQTVADVGSDSSRTEDLSGVVNTFCHLDVPCIQYHRIGGRGRRAISAARPCGFRWCGTVLHLHSASAWVYRWCGIGFDNTERTGIVQRGGR